LSGVGDVENVPANSIGTTAEGRDDPFLIGVADPEICLIVRITPIVTWCTWWPVNFRLPGDDIVGLVRQIARSVTAIATVIGPGKIGAFTTMALLALGLQQMLNGLNCKMSRRGEWFANLPPNSIDAATVGRNDPFPICIAYQEFTVVEGIAPVLTMGAW